MKLDRLHSIVAEGGSAAPSAGILTGPPAPASVVHAQDVESDAANVGFGVLLVLRGLQLLSRDLMLVLTLISENKRLRVFSLLLASILMACYQSIALPLMARGVPRRLLCSMENGIGFEDALGRFNMLHFDLARTPEVSRRVSVSGLPSCLSNDRGHRSSTERSRCSSRIARASTAFTPVSISYSTLDVRVNLSLRMSGENWSRRVRT